MRFNPRSLAASALLLCLALSNTAHARRQRAAASRRAVAASARTGVNAPVAARLRRLHALLDEQWEYNLRTNPEFATVIGDKRYNDRVSDYSLKAVEADNRQAAIFLREFEAISTEGFPEQERLNRDLMVRDLRQRVEGVRFREWEMPVTQFSGIHIELPRYASLSPFSTVKDYEDYVARLRQVPRVLEQTTERMRAGLRDRLVPPRILLAQVASQTAGIAAQKPEESPFAEPLKRFPASFSAATRARLGDEVLAAVRLQVLPAYAKFLAFVRDEYAPKGRTEIGVWALPEGAERYRRAIRELTTTDMLPEEIHRLGLSEVARIEAEQMEIVRRFGFGDLKSFNESLAKNPEVHARSREEFLQQYRRYTEQMWAQLPKLFGRLPKARLEVMPVEPFREKEASTSYEQGTPDGSRPGHVMVNTYDFENQLTISNESTAYHEGVPGHHMQIAIAQELEGLPPFRQQAFYSAFIEGWALYSERLGKEIGFYQNPYSNYGRLEDEKLRAIRLVVDTGIHYKRWTREQVLQYFRDHYSGNDSYIQSETDRYIAWPAQALAYKIGQLTILRLREKARAELGARFDLRAFHDEVLSAGALPLDVLERRIDGWIERTKAGGK
jgi:uncharacterized protein (DUF885 family)